VTAVAVAGELTARLVQAADDLRRQAGVPLVFGGLGSPSVPVTVSSGSTTSALLSMVIRPSRGLGGKALLQRQVLTVPEYRHARDITHDYDQPVLAENVVGLAVAPLLHGSRVCGLLYAATRTPAALTPGVVRRLAAAARAISFEAAVLEPAGPRGPFPAAADERWDRLREIAGETTDPGTRAALLELLDAPHQEPGILTARQREVLELAEIGLRNAQIAERLGLSEQTVKGYMRALMTRLGAASRQEAVHKYRRR
jgi:LuxR family transcriptional regulator, regulator of acetate metabolism